MSEQQADSNTPVVPTVPGASRCDRWVKGNASARARIDLGIVVPEWAPSFQCTPDAKIFAIGSCFARNLERALLNEQAQVTSADPQSDLMELRLNLQTGLLNQYNPISIQQALQWAADPNAFPAEALVDFNGKTVDLGLREQTKHGDLDFARARREKLNAYFARAFAADLVVITLGLTETWFDLVAGIALTEAPSPRLRKQYPDRFTFRVLPHAECLAALAGAIAILRERGKPDLKIVVTVSPVALQRTFSGQDVIVANLTSKSTLRSVAGEVATREANLDYFPSYEAALLSDPSLVWLEDRRNVSDFIVAQIIGEFTRRYGLKPAPDASQFAAIIENIHRIRLESAKRNLNRLVAPPIAKQNAKQN